MTFLDHLEVLRWHIIRAVFALLIVGILIFIKIDWVFDHLITAPSRSDFISYSALCNFGHWLHLGQALCMPPVKIPLLINSVAGSFTSALDIAFMGGLIVAFPYLFYELWRFVKPALSAKELKYGRGSIFWVSLCFFTGGAFGYYLLAPFTFNFLAGFKLGKLTESTYLPSLSDYIDTLLNIILACGIAFELPIIAYVLARIGLITPRFLRTYRKFAYVIILIIAAIITPSPDWISQTIVAMPLLLLYEISILITVRVVKQKEEEDKSWD